MNNGSGVNLPEDYTNLLILIHQIENVRLLYNS